jgi:UDP-N-acetylglucosamine 4,6-dehydratase/5-epimerase
MLAMALKELYESDAEIKIIGTRHGEKAYETLVNREEMLKAKDMGDYFRIPADNRNLNYELFFSKGDVKVTEIEDYHSDNTRQLDLEGTKELLLKLPIIRKDLNILQHA